MLKDLILANRSFRRFYQDHVIDRKTLEDLVELARCSASAANLQPLKYILSCDPNSNAQIFPHTAWAGYLKDWPGPKDGERPSAYIIILGDTEISNRASLDDGIAAQSIMLGAVEKGLGGCIIGSIDKPKLRQELNIPERYEILLILALGKPKETVILEPLPESGSIEYWRDERGVHHVPKRPLEELILS